MDNFYSYKKCVKELKDKLKLAYPVSIRRVKMPRGVDGDCCLQRKKFYIRIDKGLKESEAILVLIHEYAHARSWNHLHDAMDDQEFFDTSHNAVWGVAYSECYSIWEKTLD